jgi:nucleotide-binding universal stress UspA family protein
MTAAQQTIVVGYDGSASSRAALAHAVAFGDGAHVVVVHVPEARAPHATSRWRELLDAEHEEEARAALEAILREDGAVHARGTWEARLTNGRPAEAILDIAREVGADAIVVGAHGIGAAAAPLGSVPYELVARAEVPVTVIPPAAAGQGEVL